ncbi:hypothetical protein RND81_01G004400 [Saponaria officinalis]|uniref:Methyltransferase-like protein 13 n=1 Tax=Saponaria officinalis TaxID=3572 RepID=A0AAW1ND11_SAPOF
MEEGTFDTLIPSRYISFTLPLNSIIISQNHYFHTENIQISVLDSPSLQLPINSPKIAAMLVPKFRENDWIFNTELGQLQLLFSFPEISRLILIGNAYDNDNNVGKLYKRSVELNPFRREELERSLYPLLTVLLPKEIDKADDFCVPFLRYEDNVISSVILDKCIGDSVGEMLVEDVEIEIEGCSREFRRRLRFKRMPNLVQSEISIVPKVTDEKSWDFEKAGFCPNLEMLVHPYLAPMVAGLALVAVHIQERFESGVQPRGCCMGVGGGALLSFLSINLGFEVVGVEVDEVVLSVAEKYFGLETGQGIQLCVGDGIKILKKAACYDENYKSSRNLASNIRELDCCRTKFELFRSKFDVIMVDLDSSDSKMDISAPPLEFLQKDVLLAAKSCLFEHGILVLNVIPRNQTFYNLVIHALREVFDDLHELDVGNGENFVLIASKTSIEWNSGAPENVFMSKLKSVISEMYIDAIRKV